MTKYSQYKDFIGRQQLKTAQPQMYILKSILANSIVRKKFRFKIMLKLQNSYNSNNKVLGCKYKNRCMFSTKVRAVSRVTNLTKATMKTNLMFGKITGFKKATW